MSLPTKKIPREYYETRLLIGCGVSTCQNTFCRSSPQFQDPVDLDMIYTQQPPLCHLCCNLERLKSLTTAAKVVLTHLVEELFQSSESIISSFTNSKGDFDLLQAFEFCDFILKTSSPLYDAVLKGHKLFLAKVKESQQPIEAIVATLCSEVFAEDDSMGEFCSVIKRGPFLARLRVFLSKQEKEAFLCFLGNMEQFLSVQSILMKTNDFAIFSALDVMKVFYAVNAEKSYVDEDNFYNEVVANARPFPKDIQSFYTNPEKSLLKFPFVIPVNYKMKFLHQEAKQEQEQSTMQALRETIARGQQQNMNLNITIRRDHVLVDSLNQLVEANVADLKKPLHVKFEGEEGLDHGGVRKEWFQLVTRDIFQPNNNMFVYNEKTRMCWFNSTSQSLNDYKLIGTLFGLAIYNGVILEAKLPLVAYKKMLGITTQMNDLEEIQPEVLNSFNFLKDYAKNDIEETMCLTFQHLEEINGQVKTIDLKPNGGEIMVTQENKLEYIQLMTDYILNTSIEKQFSAFISGFKLVFNSRLLTIFSPRELQLLVSGSDVFDFYELENMTRYANGFNKDTPVVKWLWEILHEYPIDLKKKFLFFATGSDRSPPGGLGNLKFIVAKHGDASRLPTSSTCNNLFLLPPYESKEELKEKLTFALNNTNGFGLV
ncbi:E3 ubiquitin protein ligase HUWE1, putative [Entamoeba invadens IP1]|uniref:HECT-type E3 ubiquitin transferase n=1 Tax=Entamoeba invadens IP1 TaxID=370355 RepID=A0A0A1U7M3_ENTIV|nr:E3 ubiquitin protein ligase HUWE1, putative [Entamoeba invadens IP1]ELP90873.1 E3 ubiquitin protein ligase HUWE1, putative [Entamoeba invadens IP1]|eukprot:XP_004257644.1 E3 ubiquitin protein ligase HUWE1, putative [Entamoeba invadens IP1]